jgi:hypothetical protein
MPGRTGRDGGDTVSSTTAAVAVSTARALAGFLVGLPEPAWLERVDVFAFVSRTRLARRKRLPRARTWWALDSGGFNEIKKHGRWTITPEQYVAEVQRYVEQVGMLAWAAPMDWMYEPDQVAKTGLTVIEHQRRTVDNYLLLRQLAPDLPFVPVVQGWTVADYVRCVQMYADAGVDLAAQPVVGIGSVCRRINPTAVWRIVETLHSLGLRNLHGFGVSASALPLVADLLTSSDSQAWSSAARSESEPCPEGKTDCRNCMHRAIEYADQLGHQVGWAA